MAKGGLLLTLAVLAGCAHSSELLRPAPGTRSQAPPPAPAPVVFNVGDQRPHAGPVQALVQTLTSAGMPSHQHLDVKLVEFGGAEVIGTTDADGELALGLPSAAVTQAWLRAPSNEPDSSRWRRYPFELKRAAGSAILRVTIQAPPEGGDQ